MKKVYILTAICLLISVLTTAQTTTIILLRHAEKDTSVAGSTTMKADPPLSPQGLQRAARLPEVLKAYRPDSIYSTNYIRTRSTVMSLSQKFKLDIQLYDLKNLQAFAEKLMQLQGKTIVVAGHSNTTPALVNLLLKENKYPNLDDSVYDRIWIVTIINGKATEKLITY